MTHRSAGARCQEGGEIAISGWFVPSVSSSFAADQPHPAKHPPSPVTLSFAAKRLSFSRSLPPISCFFPSPSSAVTTRKTPVARPQPYAAHFLPPLQPRPERLADAPGSGNQLSLAPKSRNRSLALHCLIETRRACSLEPSPPNPYHGVPYVYRETRPQRHHRRRQELLQLMGRVHVQSLLQVSRRFRFGKPRAVILIRAPDGPSLPLSSSAVSLPSR